MVTLEELKNYDNIRPKGNPDDDESKWKYVDDEDRTSGRDEAAERILEDIQEEGRWPMDAIRIAEESEYSRQHITKTLRRYFEGVPEDEELTPEDIGDESKPSPEFLDVEAPTSVTSETDYLKGVIRGLWIANTQEKQSK